MPITPIYEWTNKDNYAIELRIPLKGISIKVIDVYVCDVFVKINFAPYLLLLDIEKEVYMDKYDAIVMNGTLHVTIYKKKEEEWNELTVTNLSQKERKERRKNAIERKCQREKEKEKIKKAQMVGRERYTIRKQMEIDSSIRERIEEKKEEEKTKEEKLLYECLEEYEKAKYYKKGEERKEFKKQKESNEKQERKRETSERKEEKPFQRFEEIEEEEEEEKKKEEAEKKAEKEKEEKKEEEEIEYIPPPRPVRGVAIKFTPRVFPTPQRESQRAEEEDWLARNRKYLKNHKGLYYNKDNAVESNPMWLKAKANEFYLKKDYQSAINALTDALDSTPSFIEAYTNRAACYLRRQQFTNAISDCTKALSLLTDEEDSFPLSKTSIEKKEEKEKKEENANVSLNRSLLQKHQQLKIKALLRRGAAYTELGQYLQAKGDYGVVCTMTNGQNVQIERDYQQILLLEELNERKSKGDVAYRNGKFQEAIELYTSALEVEESSIACLANRATCYLALGLTSKCIDDCTKSLAILQMDTSFDRTFLISSLVPLPGSRQRREWVRNISVRRGSAFLQEKEWKEALEDYQRALLVDPTNESLKQQIQTIETTRKELGSP